MDGSKHDEECENDTKKQVGMKRMFAYLFLNCSLDGSKLQVCLAVLSDSIGIK